MSAGRHPFRNFFQSRKELDFLSVCEKILQRFTLRFVPAISTTGISTTVSSTALIALFAATPAQAYFSVIDTGELIEPQKFQAIVEPQLILSRYDGANVVGRFDTGLTESSSVRGVLGFGKVDFQLGGFYKVVPFPDTNGQPAMGAEAGVIFARVKGETEFSLRIHPLISKRFETEVGDLIAYASLPVGFTSRGSQNVIPVQIVGGAELRPLDMANISFFAEFGLNVANSFSHISGAIAFRFDEEALRSTR